MSSFAGVGPFFSKLKEIGKYYQADKEIPLKVISEFIDTITGAHKYNKEEGGSEAMNFQFNQFDNNNYFPYQFKDDSKNNIKFNN